MIYCLAISATMTLIYGDTSHNYTDSLQKLQCRAAQREPMWLCPAFYPLLPGPRDSSLQADLSQEYCCLSGLNHHHPQNLPLYVPRFTLSCLIRPKS